MPLAAELFPEFHVVEDLAVESDPQRRVLVTHGLLATGQIDDAEPGVCQTHVVLHVKSGTVRPAMSQHPDHSSEGFRSDGRFIEIEHASNTTHTDSVLEAASASEFLRTGVVLGKPLAFRLEEGRNSFTKTRIGNGHKRSGTLVDDVSATEPKIIAM
jgi:hypothetical protein